MASVSKKGAGEFVLPGLLKITSVKVPAKAKRKGINPFTKEEQWFKAKPARSVVKVRPLKALKDKPGTLPAAAASKCDSSRDAAAEALKKFFDRK